MGEQNDDILLLNTGAGVGLGVGVGAREDDDTLPWSLRIQSSFKARWVGYPLIVFLVFVSWSVGHFMPARERFFVERDPELSYPFKTDTVPNWSLIFIGALCPLTVIVITQIYIRRSAHSQHWDRRVKDIHLAVIVLFEVLSVTWLITNIIKCYVGRLRPNFFAYCDYKGYRAAVAAGDISNYLLETTPGQIGHFSFCRDDQADAHFSFPSGHSSISFCGMSFLTFFLLHAISRINFTHHAVGKTIRFFIVLIPFFSAGLVAASRVIDYRHNVEDTVWGSLIGILGAYLAFHANYSYKRPRAKGVPVWLGDIRTTFAHNYSTSPNTGRNRAINDKSPLLTHEIV